MLHFLATGPVLEMEFGTEPEKRERRLKGRGIKSLFICLSLLALSLFLSLSHHSLLATGLVLEKEFGTDTEKRETT